MVSPFSSFNGADSPLNGDDRAAWLRQILAQVRQADGQGEPVLPPILFNGQPAGRLLDRCPELRPPLIEGLLRRGETMNVISAPKIGKSWLSLYISLCVVTGRPIFGIYPVTQGKVLLMDNELHPETLAKRIDLVARRMFLDRRVYENDLIIEPLRGQLRDWHALRPYFQGVAPGQFSLIVCDAFYRFMPRGSDENDNGTMASVYNQIDAYAEMTRASFLLVHHSTKGIQSDKAVTDVGAGAGAQSRATDTHLVLRHHEEEGVVVLDAAVRSWKPIEPVCLRWDFPLWTIDHALDPTQLRKPKRNSQRDKDKSPPDVPAEPWTVDRFVRELVTGTGQGKAMLLAAAEAKGLTGRKAEQFFRAAVEAGSIHEWTGADKRVKRYATRPQELMDLPEGGQK